MLQNGWMPYGAGYQHPTTTVEGRFCAVSGLTKRRSARRNPLTTLPPQCRPNKRLIFNLNNHEGTLRVDVLPDGQIRQVAGAWRHKWINLDGIFFAVRAQRPIATANGWASYGGVYGSATYTVGAKRARTSDLCELEGLVRRGKWGRPMVTMPASCRPNKRLIFNLNNHEKTARVDVLQNGNVVWIGGGRSHGWVSLSGIAYVKSAGVSVKLAGGWRNYGGSYKTTTASRVGMLCFVSGLVKSGTWGRPFAVLPKNCRPRGRLIFNLNNHERTARVDVLPSGEVKWIAGGRRHRWMSLTGIVLPFKMG